MLLEHLSAATLQLLCDVHFNSAIIGLVIKQRTSRSLHKIKIAPSIILSFFFNRREDEIKNLLCFVFLFRLLKGPYDFSNHGITEAAGKNRIYC